MYRSTRKRTKFALSSTVILVRGNKQFYTISDMDKKNEHFIVFFLFSGGFVCSFLSSLLEVLNLHKASHSSQDSEVDKAELDKECLTNEPERQTSDLNSFHSDQKKTETSLRTEQQTLDTVNDNSDVGSGHCDNKKSTDNNETDSSASMVTENNSSTSSVCGSGEESGDLNSTRTNPYQDIFAQYDIDELKTLLALNKVGEHVLFCDTGNNFVFTTL